MSTWALIVAYDGTDFAGYARQSDPPQRTVQAELERALSTVLRLPEAELATVVAGRTDAGVHAAGQVVSFTAPPLEAESASILRSLNALTPPDISVRALREAPEGFSARFDALSRAYCYRIATSPRPPVFTQRFAWHIPGFGGSREGLATPNPSRLPLRSLQQAARALVGEHDFSSFCVAASLAGKNPVREILSIELAPVSFFGEPLVEIRVTGTAFLHSMVRIIVGTLADIDAGRIAPDATAGILAAGDRSAAGRTAPACGLTLTGVRYEAFSSVGA
ncbi:MAG: tRNA pseudouridine(38-40) synthase TruA [Actinomycetia bacterium]|nr:tRNA pseudouridine(38-40) synthase TruA [Actinomycetes bacterium]